MPLPLIPAIAALSGAVAAKKGFDAFSNTKKASEVGKGAQKRHEDAVKNIDACREQTSEALQALGRLKVDIFCNQIGKLVDEMKKRKISNTELDDLEQCIEGLNLPEIEEIGGDAWSAFGVGLLSGATFGMAAQQMALNGVQNLPAVSNGKTGYHIVNGAAIQKSVFDWLDGGAAKIGGLGALAGGAVAIAPALAIAAWKTADKSEEVLIEARQYEAERDKDIAKLALLEEVFAELRKCAQQTEKVMQGIATVFDRVHGQLQADGTDENFQRLVNVGSALKKTLDTPIMDGDGAVLKVLLKNIPST